MADATQQSMMVQQRFVASDKGIPAISSADRSCLWLVATSVTALSPRR